MVVVNLLDGVVAWPSQHFLGPPTDSQYPIILYIDLAKPKGGAPLLLLELIFFLK